MTIELHQHIIVVTPTINFLGEIFMINLHDPRWQALGVLLALYAFIVTSLIAIPGLQGSLFTTVVGRLVFGALLTIPIAFLAIVRVLDRDRSPRLSHKNRKAIESTIKEYRKAWIAACQQNEPRYLWETATTEYFFKMEKKVQDCHESFRNSSCQSMILAQLVFLSAYALEKDVAVVRTDETWNFQYQPGQQRTQDISYRYSLRLEGTKWKIFDGERFPLDEA